MTHPTYYTTAIKLYYQSDELYDCFAEQKHRTAGARNLDKKRRQFKNRRLGTNITLALLVLLPFRPSLH